MRSASNRCEQFVISLLEFLLSHTGPPLAPPPPTFSLLGPTSVALILSNNPPFSPLPITNYTIRYFISDSPTRVTTITVTPGAVQVTLTDMQTSHSYTVTVYASNAAGMSQGTTVPPPSFQVPCEWEYSGSVGIMAHIGRALGGILTFTCFKGNLSSFLGHLSLIGFSPALINSRRPGNETRKTLKVDFNPSSSSTHTHTYVYAHTHALVPTKHTLCINLRICLYLWSCYICI